MEPEKPFKYALESNLDRAMNEYKKKLRVNKSLKEEDKNKWEKFLRGEREKIRNIADIQNRLEVYRQKVKGMGERERRDEKHDSVRLGIHMAATGLGKPGPHWHAHAMIAGGDARAYQLRIILAEWEVGIDDSRNGCWLPSSTKHSGRRPYPKAVPHSRIHRYNYYLWLSIRFKGIRSLPLLVMLLNRTRHDLQTSSFPPEVMLPKGKWDEPYDNLPPA